MGEHQDWTREELEKDYIGKMKAVTLTADIRVEGRQRVLDMAEVEAILRSSRRIAQNVCDCREKMGKCIDPMTGCLGLDDMADEDIEKGAREISVEEALEALRETYNAGLVHMAYTFAKDDRPTVICSCCTCCCHSLSAALRFGYSDHVFFSSKIARQSVEECEHCGACVTRCHFGARAITDGKVKFDEEGCSGCGLCLKICPNDAIELVPRDAQNRKTGS